MCLARFVLTPIAAIALALGTLESPPVSAAAAGGNWPQWRGPLRDGVSTETGLLPSWPKGGPPKVWSISGLGRGFSGVSVTGGRIYTMGDLRDGQYVHRVGRGDRQAGLGHAHRQGLRQSGRFQRPARHADRGRRDAVRREHGRRHRRARYGTGKERWRKSFPADFGGQMMSQWNWAESPLVDGDRVVVTPGGSRAGIVALNKLTGAEIWRSAIPRVGSNGSDGAGYSSIVISNGGGVKQYVQLMGRGVVGVRASDGVFMWGNNAVANDIANISTPVDQGQLRVRLDELRHRIGDARAFARGNGRVSATQRYFLDAGRFQSHHGGVVLLGDYLYGGHGRSQGFPVCIELATGKLMWPRTRGAGEGSAAVVAADGHLYFRYQNGIVALVEATPTAYRETGSFEIPNHHPLSWPHPVIAGGRLYLREQDALHAYNVKK